MNARKLLLASLVTGVVLNVYDFLVHGVALAARYDALSWLIRTDTPMVWLVIGDFVAAFILVLVYARVASAFQPGVRGGATFGLYAGVLINFPTWIFGHLVLVGFPYSLAWLWTVTGVAWGVLGGATAAALYKPEAAARAVV